MLGADKTNFFIAIIEEEKLFHPNQGYFENEELLIAYSQTK